MNSEHAMASNPAGAACPRCDCQLFAGSVGSSGLLACGRCGGVWLDNAACRQVMQGAAHALTELAEQAARHATVAADTKSRACCPMCGEALGCGQVPGTAIVISTCAAHGTWFDRNGLRIIALRFADLPPPLQFRKEDYQLPAPAPESIGDWVLQQALGAPAKTVNDAIPYVRGVRAGGTFWTEQLLGILLAVAVLGMVLSGAMHAASLCGHTATNGPLHLVTTLTIFVPVCLGIGANYHMGNAVKHRDGSIGMSYWHFRRGLSRVEWTLFVIVELYAGLAAWCLWPAGTNEIAVPGADLTVSNARAVWACDLLLYVVAVAVVLAARRMARRTT
jgi:Zn-finger nucleic acid-binding protein